jgi:tetratricopeptide (TPR) repeat protein
MMRPGAQRAILEMTANGSNHRRAGRLDSWKEIAVFFGRDERTVRRWERRGLPVRRLPGGGKTTVFAYVGELEAWLAQSDPAASAGTPGLPEPESPAPRLKAWFARYFAGSGRMRLAVVAVAILGIALTASGAWWMRQEPGHAASTSSRAYGFYSKGLYSWQTRTPAGLTQAIQDFNNAIAADPNFAPAWVGLADAYNMMPEYTAMPVSRAFPKALAAARRAVALDPDLADAHRALGFVEFWWSRDVAGAMAEFRRAVELDPRSAQTRHWYATALAMIGDSREALAQISTAEELAPGSTALLADKGLLLADAGRLDEAQQMLKQVETAEPDFAPVHSYLAAVYTFLNNGHAALQELGLYARLTHDPTKLAVTDAGEQGYRAGGVAEMNRRIAAKEQALYDQGKFAAFPLAIAYAPLGQREREFRLLEMAVNRHETLAMGLRIERTFLNLHGDPRFAALLAREGLPPLSEN